MPEHPDATPEHPEVSNIPETLLHETDAKKPWVTLQLYQLGVDKTAGGFLTTPNETTFFNTTPTFQS